MGMGLARLVPRVTESRAVRRRLATLNVAVGVASLKNLNTASSTNGNVARQLRNNYAGAAAIVEQPKRQNPNPKIKA
jgi:hypothetical protein